MSWMYEIVHWKDRINALQQDERTWLVRQEKYNFQTFRAMLNDHFQTGGEEVDSMKFQINSVRENTKIIRKADNWLKLAFLESLAIKE